MTIEPLGDSAYIIRQISGPAHVLAKALNASPPPGLIEAVAAYDTVGLYTDGRTFDPSAIADFRALSTIVQSRLHVVPVCYQHGPDLEEAGRMLELSTSDLIRLHSEPTYDCFAIGFCPGFPYLGYLSDRIAGLPRLGQPRPRVQSGMVGITGRQTGVYPLERPGGWRLIGQTPFELVNVQDDYFPIEAGDKVRFKPISSEEFAALKGRRL